MDYQTDRREFTRVAVKINGEVSPDETVKVCGHSRDVSVKGLFLICDDRPPIGTDCQVTLFLGAPEGETHIVARGKIARVDNSGMGIEFTQILGTESFNHLRNLVLYNSADKTEQVEQELQSHLGLKRRQ